MNFLKNVKILPDIKTDQYHIDILCAHFVLNPDKFDVIVALICLVIFYQI